LTQVSNQLYWISKCIHTKKFKCLP